jgi:hypothetical protein
MTFTSFYRDTAEAANGSGSTTSTPPSGSTVSEWAERLRAKYGIAQPMAPDDGLDDQEAEYLGVAVGALG